MTDENLRAQVNAIIRDEIQEGINEYIEETEKSAAAGFGITKHGKDEKLKINIPNDEVDKLIKKYAGGGDIEDEGQSEEGIQNLTVPPDTEVEEDDEIIKVVLIASKLIKKNLYEPKIQ